MVTLRKVVAPLVLTALAAATALSGPAAEASTPSLAPRSQWHIVTDSAQTTLHGSVGSLLDGSTGTAWMSRWTSSRGPHFINIDTRSNRLMSALTVTSRPSSAGKNGRIGKYVVQVSSDDLAWKTVRSGTLRDAAGTQVIAFTPTAARWIKLVVQSEAGHRGPWSSASEINVVSTAIPAASSARKPHPVVTVVPTVAPTVAPTTAAPTSAAPTATATATTAAPTGAPTSAAPTTAAPTTAAPTTAPTTAAPTVAPTTVAPTTVAPTTVPTTVAPTTAAPAALAARSAWTATADSSELTAENDAPGKVLDGDLTTLWHSAWNGGTLPHWIDIDTKSVRSMSALLVTARPGSTGPNGRIGQYRVEVSVDNTAWTTVATGTLVDTTGTQTISFPATTGRFIKLNALSEAGNRGPWSSAAEMDVTSTTVSGAPAAVPPTTAPSAAPSTAAPTVAPTTAAPTAAPTTAAPTATASSTSPSGVSAPVGDLTGWHQVYSTDFAAPAALGSFPNAAYSSHWGSYSDGWQDTSRNGTYMPSKVLSVHDGVLDYYIHSENGQHQVAAPWLLDTRGTTYGRYSVRFKSDALPGYKTAWLLWPDSESWPNDGEVDFPEGNLGTNDHINAFAHYASASGGQDAFSTSATYAGWHTVTVEWIPGKITFYLDNAVIGTSTTMVPSKAMHWVLQTETNLDGYAPSNAVAGHVQIDWVSFWSKA